MKENYVYMYIRILVLLLISLYAHPIFANNDLFNISVGSDFTSKNTLKGYKNLKSGNKSTINFNLEYSNNNLSSQLNFNFDDYDKFNFDNTFANYN